MFRISPWEWKISLVATTSTISRQATEIRGESERDLLEEGWMKHQHWVQLCMKNCIYKVGKSLQLIPISVNNTIFMISLAFNSPHPTTIAWRCFKRRFGATVMLLLTLLLLFLDSARFWVINWSKDFDVKREGDV